ncbi:hypothetical protein GCM10009678_02700 [Actinomadura kijaniata]
MTMRITPLPETPTLPEPDGGLGALTTDRGNLPLDTVDVRASVTGLVAGVEVVQGFRNPFDVPLEATYVFPLPDRAAVTGLRMEADDRTIEGVLKERGQARQDYDRAVAAGQRAAIAEEDRPDVFTMRVGNILPGERVTIRLTLDQPLPYETDQHGDGEATFRFPLVVAPRYIPGTPLGDEAAGQGTAPDTDAVPDASRISPPVLLPGFPNPVRLAITVDIDPAGLPLTELRSALHVTTADEDRAEGTGPAGGTVRLVPGERLDRDFILRLVYAARDGEDTAAPASLTLVPDESGAEGTFTLTVLPSGRGRPRPRDVVLVLDRSGSMHGWKMVAARRAAARIVDTLTAGDRFAVLSFDTVVERPRDLGAGLVPGTDRNRFRAVEHLASVDARGGTELLTPLQEACALLADPHRDRVLVLITDGQVGNEDQILAQLGPSLQGVRIHTVGIDQAVNAGFLNRLAEIGQGRCELVESEDRLDTAMEHIHHRIGAPLATDLSLHAEGLTLVPDTVAPSRLGALFPGVPLVVSGRFRGAPSGTLTVRGTGSDGTGWERDAKATVTGNRSITSIWARAHLRDLEDRYAVSGSDELERRIVDASLRFGVLCRFTAFVAIDSRVVTEGQAPHQVVQPVESPRGWESPQATLMAASYGAPAMPAAMPRATAAPPSAPRGGAARGTERFAAESLDVPDFRTSPAPPSPAPPSPAAPGMPAPQARRRAKGDAATQRLDNARRDLAEELRRLTDLRSASQADRHQYLLAHLLPVLETTVQDLDHWGDTPRSLSALLTDLRAVSPADPTRLDELWTRTIETLKEFTTPPPKRAFWKRRS